MSAAGAQRIPRLSDVRQAARRIRPHLAPTPFHSYPTLDALLGFRAFVKHENLNPTGAFKVRGGVNLVSRLVAQGARPTLAAASTGNHGQSVAYAARLYGLSCVVAVPKGANEAKVANMRRLGARVVARGASFDEARRWIAERSVQEGWRYVHSGNEPDLIAGVGTYALEMLSAEPTLDAIFVPVGGGSGAAGCSIVAEGMGGGTEVVGVQSSAAPAAYESWRTGSLKEVPSRTRAEGLATGVGFDLPQRILREALTDFRLVSDDAIDRAARLLLIHAHQVAEGAGAASLAAAYRDRRRLRGQNVGIVLSGGNASLDQLRRLLAR